MLDAYRGVERDAAVARDLGQSIERMLFKISGDPPVSRQRKRVEVGRRRGVGTFDGDPVGPAGDDRYDVGLHGVDRTCRFAPMQGKVLPMSKISVTYQEEPDVLEWVDDVVRRVSARKGRPISRGEVLRWLMREARGMALNIDNFGTALGVDELAARI